MLLKKKSLIVAAVSSLVLCLVLILTLVAYVIYIEFKAEELKHQYEYDLYKLNARIYSKYIDVTGFSAQIARTGPLKDRPIIEGSIKNSGNRIIRDMLIKAKFLDFDGAIIYEVIFRPTEPSLGGSSLTQLSIPYIYKPSTIAIHPGKSVSFKKIMTNCPAEIEKELIYQTANDIVSGRWKGKFEFEMLSIEF